MASAQRGPAKAEPAALGDLARATSQRAALPNLLPGGHCFMSTLRLADDVTDFASRIERAVARVPDRPGLGIEIDPEKLERYTAHRMEIR